MLNLCVLVISRLLVDNGLTAGFRFVPWQPPFFRAQPRVDLGYTSYVGVQRGSVNVFLGMRYAAPPTGDLRWRAPVEPKRDSKTHSAAEVGCGPLLPPSSPSHLPSC